MKIFVLKKLKNREYDSQDLLRKVLFDEGINDCEVKRGENGQLSILPLSSGIGWNGSVSHTKNYWVGALCQNSAVGVDIEERSRKINKGIVRMLHPLEQEYLNAFHSDSIEWKTEFLNIWTRKESFIKCLGTGLSEGLSTFSVVGENMEPADQVLSKSGKALYVSNVKVAAGLCAGICTERMEAAADVIALRILGKPLKPALEQAADLLALRNYSSAGLIKKLIEKGHTQEDAGAAVLDMQERGYIDDGNYAGHLAEQAIQKGKGKARIRRELSQKGVDELLIRDVLAKTYEAQSESESERAFEQAKRLLGYREESQNDQDDQGLAVLTEKELNKVGRKLSALGYEPSIIYEILARLRC